MYEIIIGCDPSGNFEEGKGTTAFAIVNAQAEPLKTAVIEAKDYKTQMDYWTAVVNVMLKMFKKYNKKQIVVVIEDYLLYADKATKQINSRLETPQIIGILKYECQKHGIHYEMQRAVDVKKRWSDIILEEEGIITRVTTTKVFEHCHGKSGFALPKTLQRLMSHELDAIRHAVHYAMFKNK